MPTLHVFSSSDLPDAYAHRIRSFVRVHWDHAYLHDVHARSVPEDRHPRYVVVADGPAVLSHYRVVWVAFTHGGATYRLYGLGDVFTYPAFRGRGLGTRVTAAATAIIREDPEARLPVLFCDRSLEGFYARHGWEDAPDLVAEAGGDGVRNRLAGLPMRLWLSERAEPLHSEETRPWALPGHGW